MHVTALCPAATEPEVMTSLGHTRELRQPGRDVARWHTDCVNSLQEHSLDSLWVISRCDWGFLKRQWSFKLYHNGNKYIVFYCWNIERASSWVCALNYHCLNFIDKNCDFFFFSSRTEKQSQGIAYLSNPNCSKNPRNRIGNGRK